MSADLGNIIAEPARPEVPPDCGHKDWSENCPRCFYEMNTIARQNINVDVKEVQMEGGILILWHMITVMMDMEQQLQPMTQGIDLNKNSLARQLIANLRQLSAYMMKLGSTPDKMAAALMQGALLAKQVKDAIDSGEPPSQAPLISLTDVA